MSASPLSFLRAGPPPPKVVLLPDGLFFSRAVSIAAGTPANEVPAQVELALESLSPFPLPQLYYGWFWAPGSEHAFVYGTYRRRFTTDQTASWGNAELVIPVSAALFGASVELATTVFISAAEGVTAIHWATTPVPSQVLFRPLEPEATDEDRTRVREEMLRLLGGSKTVVDLSASPVADPAHSDQEVVFRAGDFVSRLPGPMAAALDVRDKGELAALRSARKRDLLFWRLTLGCAAALLLMLLSEVGLVVANGVQKIHVAELNARAPAVQKIQDAQNLATSIQDLVTKRFLPLEMVTSVIGTNADRKPGDIVVTRIQSSTTSGSDGLYTIMLELQTTNAAQVPVYKSELQKLPECANVNVEPLTSQGDRSLFRMTVTFKPGFLKPETT